MCFYKHERNTIFMKKSNLKVKYQETEEVLAQIHSLFHFDNSNMTFKFILSAMGILVLIFMFIYGNHGGNTGRGITFFLIKYLIVFAVIFAAAMILNRTLWKKISKFTAIGEAEEEFEHKKAYYNRTLEMEMAFYDTEFHTIDNVHPEEKTYPYERVVKILESEDALGLVVKSPRYMFGGPQGLYGFPKAAIDSDKLEQIKTLLLANCPNIKKIKSF